MAAKKKKKQTIVIELEGTRVLKLDVILYKTKELGRYTADIRVVGRGDVEIKEEK